MVIKGKKGEIHTIVSLKTYIILIILGLALFYGYFYFITHKDFFQNTQMIECPKEIIPERIDCNFDGNSCFFKMFEKKYWTDGVELEYSMGFMFNRGSQEGENANYLYPNYREKDLLPKYQIENIGEDGTIYEGIRYGVYLVLDSRDKTNEGYKIIESGCLTFKGEKNYIKKNLNSSSIEETEQLSENVEEDIDQNFNTQQETESLIQKTPEEELLDFCKDKFKETSSYTEFKNSYYFDDYSKASDWLDNKYPNEGLTINKARFFKENYLDKSEFPIYIIEGSRKIDQSVIENGEYVCDKTGIVINPSNWNYEK